MADDKGNELEQVSDDEARSHLKETYADPEAAGRFFDELIEHRRKSFDGLTKELNGDERLAGEFARNPLGFLNERKLLGRSIRSRSRACGTRSSTGHGRGRTAGWSAGSRPAWKPTGSAWASGRSGSAGRCFTSTSSGSAGSSAADPRREGRSRPPLPDLAA